MKINEYFKPSTTVNSRNYANNIFVIMVLKKIYLSGYGLIKMSVNWLYFPWSELRDSEALIFRQNRCLPKKKGLKTKPNISINTGLQKTLREFMTFWYKQSQELICIFIKLGISFCWMNKECAREWILSLSLGSLMYYVVAVSHQHH